MPETPPRPADWAYRLRSFYAFAAGSILTILLSLPDTIPWRVPAAAGVLTIAVCMILNAVANRRPLRRRPVIFWIRRFGVPEESAGRLHMFLESVTGLLNGYLVVLADSTIQRQAESRVLLSRKGRAGLTAVVFAMWWFDGKRSRETAIVLTASFAAWLAWEWWTKRAKPVDETSIDALERTFRAMSLGRPDARSVLVQCPIEGVLWEQVVDRLLPLADAAVVSDGDLGVARTGEAAGLRKEIHRIEERLGLGKLVVLHHGSEAAHAPPGSRTVRIAARPSWWPFTEDCFRSLAALTEAALEAHRAPAPLPPAPRTPTGILRGATATALSVLTFFAAFAAGTFSSLIARDGFRHAGLAPPGAGVPAIDPAQFSDNWWQWTFLPLSAATALAVLHWLWRHRFGASGTAYTIVVGMFGTVAIGGVLHQEGRLATKAVLVSSAVLAVFATTAIRSLREMWSASRWESAIQYLAVTIATAHGVLIPALTAAVLALEPEATPGLAATGITPNAITLLSWIAAAVWAFRPRAAAQDAT